MALRCGTGPQSEVVDIPLPGGPSGNLTASTVCNVLDVVLAIRKPVRYASKAGFPFRELAAEEDVVFPDHFDHDWRAGSTERVLTAIDQLEPGVTEIHIQPAADTPEVRAMTDDSAGWIADLDLALSSELCAGLEERKAVSIGYRELRNAMRAAR